MDTYYYKGKPYRILFESSSKVNDEWVDSYVYIPLYENPEGKVYTREKKDFDKKFVLDEWKYSVSSFGTHPGDTLRESLEFKNISIREASDISGISILELKFIIEGDGYINSEIAYKLELLTGISFMFWMNRERNYREWKKRNPDQNMY